MVRPEMIDVEQLFGVDQCGPGRYRGRTPLLKPHKASRGVFGGNLAAQALVAVAKTVPAGFVPHSLHTYFVGPATDKQVMEWQVDEISQGKNFCNRHVRGYQEGVLKYYGNFSLTKKNSHADAVQKYEQYVEASKKPDFDHDSPEVFKPFQFETPAHEWLRKHNMDELALDRRMEEVFVYHKFTPELHDLDLTQHEEQQDVADRRISFFCRYGNEDGVQLQNVNGIYQYAGMAVISDSSFLTLLGRNLRVPGLDHNQLVHYFSVSLDHIVYFHDNDFDVTQWVGFSFRALRCVSNRVVCECEIYNHKGVHVATVIQEGLVYFNGLEQGAKL